MVFHLWLDTIVIFGMAAMVILVTYWRMVPRKPPSWVAPLVGDVGLKTCETCGAYLPPGTHRTHDGHWRCPDHKSAQ